MCELLGMSSNQPATVSLSLPKLAAHSEPPSAIRDGWGVAYFEGVDIRLIKDGAAANESDWLRFIEAHDVRSPLVMAHIRKATMGERNYRNAQPFARELAGRMHLFAHNGWLPGIIGARRVEPMQFMPIGETDSELAFCMLLERLRTVWGRPGAMPPLAERFSVVSAFASEMKMLGPANFLYSDGDALFAHGDRRKQPPTGEVKAPGLVYLHRTCQANGSDFIASGVSIGGGEQTVTLVASVPLSLERWQPLEEGEVIAISAGQIAMSSNNHAAQV